MQSSIGKERDEKRSKLLRHESMPLLETFVPSEKLVVIVLTSDFPFSKPTSLAINASRASSSAFLSQSATSNVKNTTNDVETARIKGPQSQELCRRRTRSKPLVLRLVRFTTVRTYALGPTSDNCDADKLRAGGAVDMYCFLSCMLRVGCQTNTCSGALRRGRWRKRTLLGPGMPFNYDACPALLQMNSRELAG